MHKAVIWERLGILKGRVEKRWTAWPVRKQHRFIMQLFIAYAVLAITVIFTAVYQPGKYEQTNIDHITNPIPLKKRSAAPGTPNLPDTINQNQKYGKAE